MSSPTPTTPDLDLEIDVCTPTTLNLDVLARATAIGPSYAALYNRVIETIAILRTVPVPDLTSKNAQFTVLVASIEAARSEYLSLHDASDDAWRTAHADKIASKAAFEVVRVGPRTTEDENAAVESEATWKASEAISKDFAEKLAEEADFYKTGLGPLQRIIIVDSDYQAFMKADMKAKGITR